MGCVYLARNTVNGKGYVGKTIKDLDERKEMHQWHAYDGSPFYFHRAIRKYGWDAFEWSILAEDDDDGWLLLLEQKWIKRLGTLLPNGYNMTAGGEGGVPSEDVRKRISDSLKGHPMSEKCKQILLEVNQNRVVTQETRDKMRLTRLGKKFKPMSDEGRENIRQAHIGKKRSLESNAKTSTSLRGRKRPPEVIQKIADSNRGKKRSPESRERMRLARLAFLEKQKQKE